jgi:hypothetical protein
MLASISPMSSLPPSMLRRKPVRRAVGILAALALAWAGFAQAAHYHRFDSARNVDTHLQCLLCLHIDRWAGPPELPQAGAPLLVGETRIVPEATSLYRQRNSRPYDARGPP